MIDLWMKCKGCGSLLQFESDEWDPEVIIGALLDEDPWDFYCPECPIPGIKGAPKGKLTRIGGF